MLFFGFNMLFARVPEDRKYTSFLLSRRLMGAAILVLALNYAVHFFFSIRLKDLNATILMNLVTYFLCYWLFSLAMMVLLSEAGAEQGFMVVKDRFWEACGSG